MKALNKPKSEIMKKISFLVFLFTLFFQGGNLLYGQIKLGDNIDQISEFAILELESTNKGLILPRMTTAQRDQAFSQDTPIGTIIYNIDLNRVEYLNFEVLANGQKTNLKVWEGATDDMVAFGENFPVSPNNGDLYYNDKEGTLYVWNSVQDDWLPVNKFLLDSQEISYPDGNGGSVTVDLSNLVGLPTITGSSTLVFTSNAGNQLVIDLADFNTDAQILSISGTLLSITNGNTVDLSNAIEAVETLTVLTQNASGTIVYTDEDSDTNSVTTTSLEPTNLLDISSVDNGTLMTSSTLSTALNTVSNTITNIVSSSLTGNLSTAGVSETLTLILNGDNTPVDVFDLSSFEEVKTGIGTPSTQTFTPPPTRGDLYVDTSISSLWTYDGTNWTLIEAATENIYTDNGTITSSRIITLDGDKTLTYSGGVSNTVIFDTDTRFNRAIKDSDGDVGLPGQVMTSTGASNNSVNWVYPGGIAALKTGDYILAEEGTLYVRPSGDVTITLPDPTGKEGRRVTIKRADNYIPSNTLKIVIAGGATIDKAASQNLNMSYQGYTFEAFGGEWHVVQRF